MILDKPENRKGQELASPEASAALSHEGWAWTSASHKGTRLRHESASHLVLSNPYAEKPEILAKEKEMEKKYPGIEFVHAGGKLGPKIDMDGKPKLSDELIARAPTMKELAALDSAFEHSGPSYKDPTGKKMKIGFTNDNPVPGEDPSHGPGAAYEEPDKTHPDFSYLRIFPGAASMPKLQSELSARDRADITQAHSLEGVLDHELGHATQDHTGGLSPSADAAYKRAAGWIPMTSPPSEDPDGWALKGKDGYVYKRVGENGDEHWLRLEGNAGYDKDGKYAGHFVDRFGKRLPTKFDGSERGAAGLSTPEMAEKAAVKPVGMYFPMPQEEVAEAMRAYRTSADSRARLMRSNPELYKAAKDLDQLELDKDFGKGTMQRLPDGRVVPQTK